MAAKVSPSSQDFISETHDGGEVQGPRSESSGVPPDKERMMNDQANTGVIAALMGGFALSSMHVDLDAYGAGPSAPNKLYGQLGALFWFVAFAAAHLWFVNSESDSSSRQASLCSWQLWLCCH